MGAPTVRVKVCGITTREGVEICAKNGVDEIGLNFVPTSKRYVEPLLASSLAERAHKSMRVVGVFQNQPLHEVQKILSTVRLDAVQLHGNESPEYCQQLTVPVWKVFGVGQGWNPLDVARYPGVAVRLYDTVTKGASGGTGEVFDWAQLPENPGFPWYLAGGLNPNNLLEAVSGCHPDGVDLNSGVESAPGIKDALLLAKAMEVLAPWRTGEPRLAGIAGPDTWVDDTHWPTWILPRFSPDPAQEFALILAKMEHTPRLVLDYTWREGSKPDLAMELMRLQMAAHGQGFQIKFKLSEDTLLAMLRVSLVSILDLVD